MKDLAIGPTYAPIKSFCFLTFFFGMLFALITPPFQVADENRHFMRAFQLSEGTIIGQIHQGKSGGFLYENVIKCANSTMHIAWKPEEKHSVDATIALLDISLDKQKKVFSPFASVMYSPVPYIPQIFAIWTTSVFTAKPIIMMYMARFFNLICWIALVSISIKITPVFKRVFWILALTPMALFQAASVSADCLTNGIAFLLTACFLKSAFGPQKVGTLDLCLFFVLTIILSLSKNVYFLLAGLYLLIPTEKIGSKKRYFSLFLLLLVVNVMVVLGWTFCTSGLTIFQREGISVTGQLDFIRSHPFYYLVVLAKTVVKGGNSMFNSFIGVLGWTDTKLPLWHTWLCGGVLFITAFTEKTKDISIKMGAKVLLLAIASGITILFFTLMYLCFSPVGLDLIKGIQGRYFIPLSPILFLMLYNKSIHLRFKHIDFFLVVYALISLSNTVYVLIERYYL